MNSSLSVAATERPATARSSLIAAGPERADEGGGPTTGRLENGTIDPSITVH
jgi:hypothetical protein